MTNARLEDTLAILEAAAKRKLYRRIDFFEPYKKQEEFFAHSIDKREILLMAGNQLGKTYAGAAGSTYHLTGEYPWWWAGRRYTRPVKGWAAGESSLLVRDVQQKLLCGEPGVENSLGTGMIPKEAFVDAPSLARGVTDAFDTIQVRHKSGGISVLKFKSYEQGRKKFQGETLDFIWLDEEPDMDIYSECLTRLTATKGFLFMTFTPLKGMSDVVMRFLNEKSEDRAVVSMTIDDALHIAPEDRAKIIAGYPAHEREARSKGVPMLGSGLIFKYSQDAIQEPMIENIPTHWTKLWGIDFGIDHPFAAVLLLWDRDNDVVHIHHVVRIKDALPLNHAFVMKAIGGRVPVAWPQDGHSRDKGSGEALSKQYKAHGLLMLSDHSKHPDGSNSTEAGIMLMDERMKNGKFKVAAHLSEWWEEFRLYHRKDGQIVKVRDDIMSATRIAVMSLRFSKAVPLGGPMGKRTNVTMAQDVDFDVFNV